MPLHALEDHSYNTLVAQTPAVLAAVGFVYDGRANRNFRGLLLQGTMLRIL